MGHDVGLMWGASQQASLLQHSLKKLLRKHSISGASQASGNKVSPYNN